MTKNWQLTPRQILLRTTAVLLVAGAVVAAAGAAVVGHFYRKFDSELPTAGQVMAQLADANLPLTTEIFDRSGLKIGEFTQEQRYYVPLDKIPQELINAFLSSEDRLFFQHPGYSVSGMARAALANLRNQRAAQGASTITQQLARIYFLSQSKTIERKIKEIMLAIKIEKNLPKEKILELYLNKIYLGHGSYGVEAAARNYFGKAADRLNLAEASLIAGLPKAPSRYNPVRNLQGALERRRAVLSLMLENRFISDFQMRQALGTPLSIIGDRAPTAAKAPYFVEMVRREFERKFEHWRPKTRGLKVMTSLDAAYQRESGSVFQRALDHMRKGSGDGMPGKRFATGDEVQGALVAVDPATGGILAVQGGSGFEDTQFNRALLTKRQIENGMLGIIAAAAFEHGYTPTSLVGSDPYLIKEAPALREGTVYSMLAGGSAELGFQLFTRLGADIITRTAKRCGLPFDADNLLVGLGMGEASPLKLASCYSAFAAEGLRRPTFVIDEIRSREGEILYQRQEPRPIRVVGPESAFAVNYILRDLYRHLLEGDRALSRAVNHPGNLPQTGIMTAVSDDLQNVWLNALTPSASIVTWFGSEKGKVRVTAGKAEGRRFAAHVAAALLKSLPADRKTFKAPAGVSYEKVPLELSQRDGKADHGNRARVVPRFPADREPALGARPGSTDQRL